MAAAAKAGVMDKRLLRLVTDLTIVEPGMVKADRLPVGQAVTAAALAAVMCDRFLEQMAEAAARRIDVVESDGRPRFNTLVAPFAAPHAIMVDNRPIFVTTGASGVTFVVVRNCLPVSDVGVTPFAEKIGIMAHIIFDLMAGVAKVTHHQVVIQFNDGPVADVLVAESAGAGKMRLINGRSMARFALKDG